MSNNQNPATGFIEQWLRKKHVQVPDGWVPECVAFLKSEGIKGEALLSSVYEQWQFSDLSTLQEPVLDKALKSGEYFQGTYALQVNYVIDIGKSKYSQLRAVIGANDNNLDVRETEESTNKWEPKPTRCLMLEVTDGVSKVKAIEMEYITEVDGSLEPGVKILIKGPLRYFSGCILLTTGSISVLGGKADELKDTMKPQFTLEKMLQSYKDNDMKNKELCKMTFSNSGKVEGKTNNLGHKNPNVLSSNPHPMASRRDNSTWPYRPLPQGKKEVKPEIKNPDLISSNDWDDDIDDAEFMSMLHTTSDSEPKLSQPTVNNCSFNSNWSEDFHDIDKSDIAPQGGNVKPTKFGGNDKPTKLGGNVKPTKLGGNDKPTKMDGNVKPTKLATEADKTKVHPSSGSVKSIGLPCNITKDVKVESLEEMDWSDEDDLSLSLIETSPTKQMSAKKFDVDANSTKFKNNSQVGKKLVKNQMGSLPKDFVDLISSDEDDFLMNDESFKYMGGDNSSLSTSSRKSVGKTKTPKQTSKLVKNGPKKECSGFHKAHFTYLSEFKHNESYTTTVKAHIVTVLAKIGISEDKSRWTLPVRINDGTNYLDCQIGHKIIEKYIGPVKQTIYKSKENLIEKKLVIQKMKEFASWLSQANGMFELHSSGSEITIVSMRSPNDNDLVLFKECLAEK